MARSGVPVDAQNGTAWLRRAAGVATVVVGACASGTGFRAGPPEGMDLNGVWRLNERATDEQAAEASGSDRRPQRVRRRGGGASGAPGRTQGGGMIAAGGAGGIAAATPAAGFVLTQTDSAVTFAFTSKNSVAVPTDGRKITAHSWPNLGEVELKARWTDDGLRLERRIQDGGSLVEIYSRTAGSDRLIVRLELEGRAGRMSLVRVYERVEE